MRWSWPAMLATCGLACIVGSVTADGSIVATVLLGAGIAAAAFSVGAHVAGTLRAGDSL